MRRTFAVILSVALCFAAAQAATLTRVNAGERFSADIDADGRDEVVLWKMQPAPDAFDDSVQLFVEDASGGICSASTQIVNNAACLVTDLNGDGHSEIFVSGDIESYDFYTWAFTYDDEGLHELFWPRCYRDKITNREYVSPAYGRLDSLSSDNSIVLGGTQDVLGTWYCARSFRYTGKGFEFADDAFGVVNAEDPFDGEDSACLCLARDTACTIGSRPGTLKAGERIVITETDRVSYIRFRTEDGRTGRLDITPNDETGFGSLIGNLPEDEVFDYLPYSD